MKIIIEFGGGAELLFGNKKSHEVDLPKKETNWDMQDLLNWIKDNLLQERPELFIQDKSIRPGILVLVNDTDWELLMGQLISAGCNSYKILPNDRITFISTLHGG